MDTGNLTKWVSCMGDVCTHLNRLLCVWSKFLLKVIFHESDIHLTSVVKTGVDLIQY